MENSDDHKFYLHSYYKGGDAWFTIKLGCESTYSKLIQCYHSTFIQFSHFDFGTIIDDKYTSSGTVWDSLKLDGLPATF